MRRTMPRILIPERHLCVARAIGNPSRRGDRGKPEAIYRHGAVFPWSPVCSQSAELPKLQVLPRDLTFDLPLQRRPPLSDLTVQHVGQHLALVVAETPEQASFAASLFELDYVGPADLNAHDLIAGTPAPDEKEGQIRHGSYFPDHFVKLEEDKLQDRRGAEGEPKTSIRIASQYSTPLNAHYPIELSATIAYWEGDKLTVHDSTRWITGERKALAATFGIPEDKIRILSPLVGGAFGSKSFLWMHVVLTAVARAKSGAP